VKRSEVQAFLDRDWAGIERAKRTHWSARRRAGGLAEATRVMSGLRAHASRLRPDYPTPADREADLETHRRVAAALARCPRPGR
jgi:hypothetical protein